MWRFNTVENPRLSIDTNFATLLDVYLGALTRLVDLWGARVPGRWTVGFHNNKTPDIFSGEPLAKHAWYPV